MTPEFRSRRKSGPELVEEARAAREVKGPDVDRMIEAPKAGGTVTIRLPPIRPRPPTAAEYAAPDTPLKGYTDV